ncbi:hypothetical protein [Streptomyces sp. NPDC057740]|uniref:hypothetical protein n=1 Tax=Streptomyces sp. NPDC057740 TaxID=3346234 RepID=UPI00369D4587
MLLNHVTVTVIEGELHLTFADPWLAAEWRDSDLQAALQQCGHDMPVDLGPEQESALL